MNGNTIPIVIHGTRKLLNNVWDPADIKMTQIGISRTKIRSSAIMIRNGGYPEKRTCESTTMNRIINKLISKTTQIPTVFRFFSHMPAIDSAIFPLKKKEMGLCHSECIRIPIGKTGIITVYIRICPGLGTVHCLVEECPCSIEGISTHVMTRWVSP